MRPSKHPPQKLTEKAIRALLPENKPYYVSDTKQHGFKVRVQPTGRKTFYVTYQRPGNKRKRPHFRLGPAGTDELSLEGARKLAAKVRGRALEGVDPGEERKLARTETEGFSFESFLDKAYEPHVLDQNGTGSDSMRTLRNEFDFLFNKKLGDITTFDIDKWRISRKKDKLAASTINRYRADLSAALSYAVDRFPEQIMKNPCAKVRREREDNKRARYLSQYQPDEKDRLFKALDDREEGLRASRDEENATRVKAGLPPLQDLRACAFADELKIAVLVAMKTGIRRGEMLKLRWENVVLDGESPRLSLPAPITKTHKARDVDLSPGLMFNLRGWKDQGSGKGLVFPHSNSEREEFCSSQWRQVRVAAGIPLTGREKFTWHDLRHDFCSMLVQAGVPLTVVMKLAGHRDYKTTLRYAHLAPENTREAVTALDESDDAAELRVASAE